MAYVHPSRAEQDSSRAQARVKIARSTSITTSTTAATLGRAVGLEKCVSPAIVWEPIPETPTQAIQMQAIQMQVMPMPATLAT